QKTATLRLPLIPLPGPSPRERGEGEAGRSMTAFLSPFTGRGCRQAGEGQDLPLHRNGRASMTGQIVSAVLTVVLGVAGCVAYFWGANRLLDLTFPSRGVQGHAAIDNLRRQGLIRPWLFLGPALIILAIYLVYPVIETARLSFLDGSGRNFVGTANYEWAIGDREFRQAIFNNLLWLAVVPAACTFLGLVIAVLTDRIWWGSIAKMFVFMPLAISFVGASVIW